jgi:outer membrane receptor protein involved in Fe transport
VKVEERRTEEGAVVTWTPSPKITLEAALRVEASTISSDGDVVQQRSLVYAKPRAVLTFSPDPSDQVRLRFEREVSQLDFTAFAATGSLNAGGVRAGNPALLPQDTWVSELALERKFWGKGDLMLTGRHSEISSAVDRVQLDGYDEPGNVGHARQEDFRIDLALPLDRLFIKNGLIRGAATWSWSNVADPTTGQTRPLSNMYPFSGNLHFTQDVTAWRSTWGVDVGFRNTYTVWRVAELDFYTYGTLLRPFFEYKPTERLTLRFEIDNALDRTISRTLTYYTGPRGPAAVFDKADLRAERPGRTALFRIRQGF